jgi:glucokinase
VIAIAGGLVNDGDLFLAPIRQHFLGHIEGATHRPTPEIVAATLGERAGVIGAAILALDTATA